MRSATKNKKISDVEPVAIDSDMKDYSKDPYFIKKHEQALAFLKKAGIPEDFKKKKK